MTEHHEPILLANSLRNGCGIMETLTNGPFVKFNDDAVIVDKRALEQIQHLANVLARESLALEETILAQMDAELDETERQQREIDADFDEVAVVVEGLSDAAIGVPANDHP